MAVRPTPPEAAEAGACRSPARFLWWLVVSQRRRAALAALLGGSWMVLLALPPYLLSRAVDDGLRAGDGRALLGWAGAVLATGLLLAWLSIMRHRTMTRIRNDAALRTVRAVTRQALRLGASLPRHVTAGEVLTIGIGDVAAVATSMSVVGPGVGAVLCCLAVAAVLLSVSPPLALVVLLGVPVLALVLGPLLRGLQGPLSAYRDQQGLVAARVADLAAGLRVLGGLGGKEAYAARHRRESRALQAEGYRVASLTSWVDAAGAGLPALFLAVVVWLAARAAAQGAISVGDLVAVYGYVAVLVVPVSFFIEGGHEVSEGLVAARRVVRFLGLAPEDADAADGDGDADEAEPPAAPPAGPAVLYDPGSGVEVAPGLLTALVCAPSAGSAAVVDRLGRFTPSGATWGGTRLDAVPLAAVRERIVVADNEAHLFSGTLRSSVEGRAPRARAALERALHAAAAEDIAASLPGGLDAPLDDMGRNVSGGQRQRLRLARALLADPEVLLAVEPTSAVDAHTEALLAARLRDARAGRTTVVTTTSPLVLDQADVVCHLVDGRVAATGTHRELLADERYRALVARDPEEAP
ncbi:ABC transporter transmembrane domain-containing protein [Streptomyces montanisoli]|uniref:ABC transporter ATP-binding protein n=1 Tax=Streptomyces montanisoli TaxID=2798581 RepID=A0A940MGV0_9ACTN|nr:ABC transporter ATP-binding protein [Streptomyces montanisoli]MBP0460046.1 ABC transporter ATP-binding protein [Streptomyces montanisoli]